MKLQVIEGRREKAFFLRKRSGRTEIQIPEKFPGKNYFMKMEMREIMQKKNRILRK